MISFTSVHPQFANPTRSRFIETPWRGRLSRQDLGRCVSPRANPATPGGCDLQNHPSGCDIAVMFSATGAAPLPDLQRPLWTDRATIRADTRRAGKAVDLNHLAPRRNETNRLPGGLLRAVLRRLNRACKTESLRHPSSWQGRNTSLYYSNVNNEQLKLVADSLKIVGLGQFAVFGFRAIENGQIENLMLSLGVAVALLFVAILVLMGFEKSD